jgi:hypothetical protein
LKYTATPGKDKQTGIVFRPPFRRSGGGKVKYNTGFLFGEISMHETSGYPARVALRDVATPGDNSASGGLSATVARFCFEGVL